MLEKSEKRIQKVIREDLTTHGYNVKSGSELNIKQVDILARKGRRLFAIEVKGRPIETIDILSSSTISMKLKKSKDFQGHKIIGVIATDSAITEKAKSLGKKAGVVVTEASQLRKNLESYSVASKRKSRK